MPTTKTRRTLALIDAMMAERAELSTAALADVCAGFADGLDRSHTDDDWYFVEGSSSDPVYQWLPERARPVVRVVT